MWTLVIPVKGTAAAKSRLHGGVELSLAIALDTVAAALSVGRVIVVTGSANKFAALGAGVVPDPGSGLSGAIAAGIAAAGTGPVAILLGDLPALTAAELRDALADAAGHRRAMVSDADTGGTTMITALDPADHAPAFGEGSGARHRAAGYHELQVPADSGLRRDVDTLEQLEALRGRLGPRTTAAIG